MEETLDAHGMLSAPEHPGSPPPLEHLPRPVTFGMGRRSGLAGFMRRLSRPTITATSSVEDIVNDMTQADHQEFKRRCMDFLLADAELNKSYLQHDNNDIKMDAPSHAICNDDSRNNEINIETDEAIPPPPAKRRRKSKSAMNTIATATAVPTRSHCMFHYNNGLEFVLYLCLFVFSFVFVSARHGYALRSRKAGKRRTGLRKDSSNDVSSRPDRSAN